MPMRIKHRVNSDYFEWLYDLVCGERFAEGLGYRQLLTFLHDTEFVYFVPYDENRAADGVSLRYRFCVQNDCEELESYIDGPCSVLEMMIALSFHCEEIMDNITMGDRTGQWFWEMISNLGLGAMNDTNFNEWLVNDVITRFLERDYEPDGRGGLFRIRGWDRDARREEIWRQLLAYTNSMM